MNGALTYLTFKRLKNSLLSIFKSPSKVIYGIFAVVMIGITIFSANIQTQTGTASFRDINELGAIIFAFYTMMFVMIAKNGFNNGATMFSMSDVNLIFPAPIRPQKVLFYGLIKQMGTSLLLGFFLLFQYTLLNTKYGINYGELLCIVLGYSITIFCAQLTAMVIYSLSSSNERTKKILKVVFYGVLLIYALIAISFMALDSKNFISRFVLLVTKLPVILFPVSGWAKDIVFGIITSNIYPVLIGLSLFAGYVVVLVIVIVKSKIDYYEDVLKTTELAQNAITAKKEGNVGESVVKNVKVGKTGLNKGFGANAFYYKHLIENRRSKIFIVDMMSLAIIAATIVFSFFMKDAGIIGIFVFSCYMQICSAALGRLPKELIKPFIYLVPESSFKKLFNCIRESFLKIIVEALLIFIPVAFIAHLTAVETLLCIFARITFALLFTAGNILVEKVFGFVRSKALIYLFYFGVLMLISIPGIVLAVFLIQFGFILVNENITMLLALSLCNIPMSLLTMFLSRNMLEYAELNGR